MLTEEGCPLPFLEIYFLCLCSDLEFCHEIIDLVYKVSLVFAIPEFEA